MGLGIDALSLGVCHRRDMHTTTKSIDIDSLPLGMLQVERVLAALLAA